MIEISGTYKSYIVGLLTSIALTFFAYYIVVYKPFDCNVTRYGLITLAAVLQIVVQVVFFLHINEEGKPRLNLMSFIFTLIVVFIIVAGSLWVMYNLNVNMMV